MSQKRQHKLKANRHLKSNHRWFVSSRQLASCFCLYFHCSVCCCFVIIYLETPLAYLNYKKVKFVVCWCWCAPVQKSCTAQKQRKENKNTPKNILWRKFPFHFVCILRRASSQLSLDTLNTFNRHFIGNVLRKLFNSFALCVFSYFNFVSRCIHFLLLWFPCDVQIGNMNAIRHTVAVDADATSNFWWLR